LSGELLFLLLISKMSSVLPRLCPSGILEVTRIVTLNTPTEYAGDAFHIEGLEICAHVGVPDDERSSLQRLAFNMTFWPKRQATELEDEIGQTVDYAAVCAETKNFVRARADRLIETLADALANHLLEVFEIRRITIELRKFILPEVEFVSVTVTRDRSAE
jgi:dihydroneopterin aldolase